MSESDEEEEYVYEEDENEYQEGTEDEEDPNTSDGLGSDMKMGGGKSHTSSGFTPMEDGYTMKTYDDIAPYMTAMLSEVSSLFDLDIDQAQILLQHKKWQKEKLIDWFLSDSEEKKTFLMDLDDKGVGASCNPPVTTMTEDNKWYMKPGTGEKIEADAGAGAAAKAEDSEGKSDSKNSDYKTFKADAAGATGAIVGAEATTKEAVAATPLSLSVKVEEFQCPVCYEYETASFSLGCDHRFCYDCYAQYISSQISEGPTCIFMQCPQHKCTKRIPKTVISRLIDSAIFAKYSTYVSQNFIESNRSYRFCPGTNCNQVAVGSGVTNIKCSCGNNFCFKCGDDAHEPSSCVHLEAWNLKCHNESETANWIIVNTKKCPECNSRIEKNQGCNHMKCQKCAHDFCWICLAPWSEHNQETGGYYKCNRFETGKAVKVTDSDAEQAKAELERYLHFYQRFHGHDDALKYARKARADAESRMIDTKDSSTNGSTSAGNWLDVQFLRQAADLVIECRRLLKYTYVLGYFLKDDIPEKVLFEHQQEMLEKNTERLQEAVEEPNIELIDRAHVVNLGRVTEKFMLSLQGSMSGGEVQDASVYQLASAGAMASP